jgi:transketolase
MALNDFIHRKAIELGKEVLRMTTTAGSGHPSSALSLMHIVGTLMYDVMRWDPNDPWAPANDRLILSEGHAVPVIYAYYADMGGIVGRDRQSARKLTPADLATLRETNSPLDGHPNPAEGFPFFDAATGSLGQGLSVAAGLACAARLRASDKRVYVLIGDGECREGQIWEAMDLVVDKNLTNVVAIFNCNGQGQADYVSKQQSAETVAAKARAFGWQVAVIDGHDANAIKDALAEPEKRARPLAIVAKTEKGWGCDLLKDKSNHGKPLAADQLDKGVASLDAMYDRLGVPRSAPATADKFWPARPAKLAALDGTIPEPLPFDEAMKRAGLAAVLAKGQMATRRAYGVALVALGEADPRIVALDGDVGNSTHSDMLAKKYPDRFVECKIAEQNMISTAVGLAAAGYIPFASTFAKFAARGYDQVELAQIGRANIKIVGSHAGVSLGADGPSQMGLQDVAYFRSASQVDDGYGRPVCISLHPSDAVAAYYCTWLLASHRGMAYMRTHRPDAPFIYSPATKFEIGGSHRLTDGNALTIVAAGYMVHVCLDALRRLEAEGVKCTLFDAYSFPLKVGPILTAARDTGGKLLSVEDNYIGGLGSTLAEAAAEFGGIRVHSMTCRRIPKSTRSAAQTLALVGLSVDNVIATAKRMIG